MNKKSKPASKRLLKRREFIAPRRQGPAKKPRASDTALNRSRGLTLQEIAALPPTSKKLRDWIRTVDLQKAQAGRAEIKINPALSAPTGEPRGPNYLHHDGNPPAGGCSTGLQNSLNELTLLLFKWSESDIEPTARELFSGNQISSGTIVHQPNLKRREQRTPRAARATTFAPSDHWPRISVRFLKSKTIRVAVLLARPVSPP